MVWWVNGVQQSWSEAPFAVIKGALSGRRLEMFTQRNELGGSWPRWAVIAIAVVLLIPVKLICLGNAVVKKMCDLVQMARGHHVVVRRRILPVAHRMQTTLGENQQERRIAINNQQIENWSRIEFQYFGKIGQDVFRRSICSYLRQDESARLAAVCKKYFVFFRKDVETTIGEEYTKAILAADKGLIQNRYYLWNAVCFREEVRTRNLFQRVGLSYPQRAITMKPVPGSGTLVMDRTRWLDIPLKFLHEKFGDVNGAFQALQDDNMVRLVSPCGEIGFLFRCRYRVTNTGSTQPSIVSGLLLINGGDWEDSSQCKMEIIHKTNTRYGRCDKFIYGVNTEESFAKLAKAQTDFIKIGDDTCEVQLETTALSSLEAEMPA